MKISVGTYPHWFNFHNFQLKKSLQKWKHIWKKAYEIVQPRKLPTRVEATTTTFAYYNKFTMQHGAQACEWRSPGPAGGVFIQTAERPGAHVAGAPPPISWSRVRSDLSSGPGFYVHVLAHILRTSPLRGSFYDVGDENRILLPNRFLRQMIQRHLIQRQFDYDSWKFKSGTKCRWAVCRNEIDFWVVFVGFHGFLGAYRVGALWWLFTLLCAAFAFSLFFYTSCRGWWFPWYKEVYEMGLLVF